MKRRVRVIEHLRRMFPGQWRYDLDTFRWVGPDFEVYAEAALVWGYDDSFITQYRRSDTRELVSIPGRLMEIIH